MAARTRILSRDERGMTLVETIVAAFVLLVGVLSTTLLVQQANRTTQLTKQREAATNLAREIVEAARSIRYDQLATTTLVAELSAKPGLADDVPGGEYVISRRGTEYTVAGSVCVMDDFNDGAGARVGTATFCADAPAPGTADRNPEDYKRVRIAVTWKTNTGRQVQVAQTGVVNNPGSAIGPAVRTLAPVGFTLPVTTALNSLDFNAQTSSRPAAINWLLDGTVQADAPTEVAGSNGRSWSFSWNITSVPDGPYLVSAEAFDQYGVSGPSRSLTVLLNRFAPATPRNPRGGRSLLHAKVVDLEWAANQERDVVGYTVFRDGRTEAVCALSLRTTCRDDDAPAGLQVYRIYAHDHAPDGTLRRSESPAVVETAEANTAPFPVSGLTATFEPGGYTQLKWTRPSPEDPDDGDAINFYRIYRDGIGVANRYDAWNGGQAEVVYQDYHHKGVSHKYWISAVDKRYGESALVGPVEMGP